MKPSEHWNRDDPSICAADAASVWPRNALAESLVRSGSVEVSGVLAEYATKMLFAQDDHLVEALAANAAEEALADGVHVRRAHCRRDDPDTRAGGYAVELRAEFAIVAQEQLRSDPALRRVAQLLGSPGRARTSRNREMNHLARAQVDDEEREQRPEPHIIDLKKIARPGGVVAQKRSPTLTVVRWTYVSDVALNGSFREADTQLEEFAPNALGAPRPIRRRHVADKGDGVPVDPRRARPRRNRSRLPEDSETLSMPAKNGLGLDQEHGFAPLRSQPRQRDEYPALVGS